MIGTEFLFTRFVVGIIEVEYTKITVVGNECLCEEWTGQSPFTSQVNKAAIKTPWWYT